MPLKPTLQHCYSLKYLGVLFQWACRVHLGESTIFDSPKLLYKQDIDVSEYLEVFQVFCSVQDTQGSHTICSSDHILFLRSVLNLAVIQSESQYRHLLGQDQ